jgi:hypothetical protein
LRTGFSFIHYELKVVPEMLESKQTALVFHRHQRITATLLQMEVSLTPETERMEYPYCVKVETSTGQSASIPIAFLTPNQIEDFLQFDFKRLVQEAGVKAARIHVERATTADYDKVLRDIDAWLRAAVKPA